MMMFGQELAFSAQSLLLTHWVNDLEDNSNMLYFGIICAILFCVLFARCILQTIASV